MSLYIDRNDLSGLTTPQKAARSKAKLVSSIMGGTDALKTHYAQMLKVVWENEFGFTAQQIFTNLGANGEQLVDVLDTYYAAILAVDPDWAGPQRPQNLVVNQDGTVTIT